MVGGRLNGDEKPIQCVAVVYVRETVHKMWEELRV